MLQIFQANTLIPKKLGCVKEIKQNVVMFLCVTDEQGTEPRLHRKRQSWCRFRNPFKSVTNKIKTDRKGMQVRVRTTRKSPNQQINLAKGGQEVQGKKKQMTKISGSTGKQKSEIHDTRCKKTIRQRQ